MKTIEKQKPIQRRKVLNLCTIFRLAKPAFFRYLKKAGLASRNIVHKFKTFLRCIGFCLSIVCKVNSRGAQLLLGMPRSIVKSFFLLKKWSGHFMKRRQTGLHVVHCWIERREESVLEDINLREYFSLYLFIYSMETYALWFRITS